MAGSRVTYGGSMPVGIVAGGILLSASFACGQSVATSHEAEVQSSQAETKVAAFEVATIKPVGPASGMVGFLSYPGGRVAVGSATVKMLIYFAFDVQDFQIAGGPGWAGTERYDVVALPPATSASATAKQPPRKATPSAEQRQMLQALLADRFGFKFHREMRDGTVYWLERGDGPLQMQDAKDPDADSRGGVTMKSGGIVDGVAFGTNVSMTFLAAQLTRNLGRPVLDRTGLSGGYDFHLPPDDPENHDMPVAVFDVVRRLGLKLRAGKGPVDTIVIDSVTKPTEN